MFVGAIGMYFLDPDRGARRRAFIRDKTIRLTRRTRESASALGSDLQNRAHGMIAEMRARLSREAVDDRRLEARVRAELGRVCSHPKAITVFASGGHVTLSGPILAAERAGVLRAVGSVRGVREVTDALEPHEQPGSIPALQGAGRPRPGQGWRWRIA
jgi:hypothetical protein